MNMFEIKILACLWLQECFGSFAIGRVVTTVLRKVNLKVKHELQTQNVLETKQRPLLGYNPSVTETSGKTTRQLKPSIPS